MTRVGRAGIHGVLLHDVALGSREALQALAPVAGSLRRHARAFVPARVEVARTRRPGVVRAAQSTGKPFGACAREVLAFRDAGGPVLTLAGLAGSDLLRQRVFALRPGETLRALALVPVFHGLAGPLVPARAGVARVRGRLRLSSGVAERTKVTGLTRARRLPSHRRARSSVLTRVGFARVELAQQSRKSSRAVAGYLIALHRARASVQTRAGVTRVHHLSEHFENVAKRPRHSLETRAADPSVVVKHAAASVQTRVGIARVSALDISGPPFAKISRETFQAIAGG